MDDGRSQASKSSQEAASKAAQRKVAEEVKSLIKAVKDVSQLEPFSIDLTFF